MLDLESGCWGLQPSDMVRGTFMQLANQDFTFYLPPTVRAAYMADV